MSEKLPMVSSAAGKLVARVAARENVAVALGAAARAKASASSAAASWVSSPPR